MVTLLKLWKHARQEGPKSRPPVTGSPVEPDTLLLLIPDGGPSFRLLPFAAKELAQAYIQSHDLIARQRGLVAFWVLHTASVPQRLADGQPPEAIVMIRAPGRPGVVYLYSFVDMETACSSLRNWLANGLEPANVLLYWAAPVTLDGPAALVGEATAPETDMAGRPADYASTWPSPAAPAAVHSDSLGAGHPHFGRATQWPAGPAQVPAPAQAPDKPGDVVGKASEMKRSPVSRIMERIVEWPGWDGLAPRMVGSALFHEQVYEDVGRDPQAKGRAALIVGLGTLAAGIGSIGAGPGSVAWHMAGALVGWAAFAIAVYVIGTEMLGGRRAPLVQFFSMAGLASSPALLFVLAALPVYGMLLALAVSVWVCAATAIALTTALEMDRQSAIFTAAMGWVVYFGVALVFPMLL